MEKFNKFLDEKGHTHIGYPMLGLMYLALLFVVILLMKGN